jgi:hypothetical protein
MKFNSEVPVSKFPHAWGEEECIYDFDGTPRRKETSWKN